MQKLLLINGSPHEKGNTYSALMSLAQLLCAAKIDTEIFHIGTDPISGCIDCGKCIRTNKCSIDDAVNLILDKLDDYSGIIIGSPVYFGGPTGQLIAFLERLFIASHGRMTNKFGTSVVCCNKDGSSATINFINNYFNEGRMLLVGSHFENQVYNPEKPELSRNNMQSLAKQMIFALNHC